MAKTTLVSIIMPAYNAEDFIGNAILSVLSQTYKNWELIVINDGSIDETARIVSSFDDQRICLVGQKNKGVSFARNSGLEKAKGKYITFLDADDILPSSSLEVRVEYLQTHPEADLVDGRVIVKDVLMDKTIRIYMPYYTGNLLPRLVALDDKVFFNVCYMLKRTLLNEQRFSETMTHSEDLLFYIEMSSNHSVNYGFVDEPVYWYRSGHDSAMANLDGLEKGYVQLLQSVGKMANITLGQKLYMRLRIVRIMVLSWLRRKKIFRAVRSLLVVLVAKSSGDKDVQQ